MEKSLKQNLKVRPSIKTVINNDETSSEELFQNNVLRPIIKMQHDLLIAVFKSYIQLKKINFKGLPEFKQIEFLESIIKTDLGFKGELKGLIIGHFTMAEYQEYLSMKAEMNKRIVNIIRQRAVSNLPELIG